MNDISEIVLTTINSIQKRPKMFIPMVNPDFWAMRNFLIGYLYGVGDIAGIPYNRAISDWLRETHNIGSALIWTEYIFHIVANGDEKKAYDLLFDTIKKYFHEDGNRNIER